MNKYALSPDPAITSVSPPINDWSMSYISQAIILAPNIEFAIDDSEKIIYCLFIYHFVIHDTHNYILRFLC